MASLTPLSKTLIGLVVVGAMASAVWHLGLKDRLGPWLPPAITSPAPKVPSTSEIEPQPPAAVPDPSPPISPVPTPVQASSDAGLSPAEHAERGRQLLRQGQAEQARWHLEQAVAGGDAAAACHLGDMTLQGQGGLSAQHEAAARLFQLAQARGVICFAASR